MTWGLDAICAIPMHLMGDGARAWWLGEQRLCHGPAVTTLAQAWMRFLGAVCGLCRARPQKASEALAAGVRAAVIPTPSTLFKETPCPTSCSLRLARRWLRLH